MLLPARFEKSTGQAMSLLCKDLFCMPSCQIYLPLAGGWFILDPDRLKETVLRLASMTVAMAVLLLANAINTVVKITYQIVSWQLFYIFT